jgi:ATP-dependent RNA helicase RhlE
LTLTSFNDFGLAAPITRALAQENYVTPTPIQADALPLVLAGRDLIGIAQTGTGKTAAFALPILNRLANNPLPLERKSCRVLVLSPTRELSGQILESFRTYGRHLRLSSTLAIGGVPMGKQVRALMGGVDVLVATPGRLLDLVQSNALRLNRVEVLVLDEADRMLDMGFINDIRKIITKIPVQRQTLLFSATMPREIADLASSMLRDPARVAVTPVASTVERIAQRVIHTDRAGKPALLVQTLKGEPMERALVFTRTKHGADKVVRSLNQSGIAAEALHGNKSQGQRDRVMAAFRNGRVMTLVATDIAARGIDVDGISHVINYDLPNIPESYVHRIGRTARAGAEGVAISFCDAEEGPFLRDIERLIGLAIPATGEPQGSRGAGQRSSNGQRNGQRKFGGQRPGNGQHSRSGQRNGNGRYDPHTSNGQRSGQPEAGQERQDRAVSSRPEGVDASASRGPKRSRRGRRDQRDQQAQGGQRGNQGNPGGEIGGVAFLKRRDEPRGDRARSDMDHQAR